MTQLNDSRPRHLLNYMRKALGFLLVSFGLLIWLPGSDILILAANQDAILLGRYSLERFSALLLVTPLAWAMGGILMSGTQRVREPFLRMTLVVFSAISGLLLISALSKLVVPQRYVQENISQATRVATKDARDKAVVVKHRLPNLRLQIQYSDQPSEAKAYPGAKPGYPPIQGTLTTDDWGFRNRNRQDRYDIVVAGDSFTEGSHVSDEHPWPVILSQHSGFSVYNIGNSGLAPRDYLNNFVSYGLRLKPDILIVMFYEGNDFVIPVTEPRPGLLRRVVQYSPVRLALKSALIRTFGPLRADVPLPQNGMLSWLPIPIRTDDKAHYYNLRPRDVPYFLATTAPVQESPQWRATIEQIRHIQTAAEENDIRLILAYAPAQLHVFLPLVRDRVSDAQLHDFIAMRRKHLPAKQGLKDHVYARLDSAEDQLRAYCQANGIEFFSLTSLLRQRMLAGEQVFFSYDTHWTPQGHTVVGNALAEYLRMSPATVAGDTAVTGAVDPNLLYNGHLLE